MLNYLDFIKKIKTCQYKYQRHYFANTHIYGYNVCIYTNMNTKKLYDVAIIGSGIGGLTLANILAQ